MTYGERRIRCFRVAAAAMVALLLSVACGKHAAGDAADRPVAETRSPAPTPPPRDVAPAEDGIALAIVYDTSGSMAEMVKNAAGGAEAKHAIAARALNVVIDRLATFQAAPTQSPRRLDVGLWVFSGANVVPLQPMTSFDADALRRRVAQLGAPHAETPLGEGLATAAAAAFGSRLARRHVLVITDGMNTTGRDPAGVLTGLVDEAKRRDTTLGVHFVAFDLAASVFAPLKRLGATVLAATDERTLGEQLGFILVRKILLEDEEPAASPK